MTRETLSHEDSESEDRQLLKIAEVHNMTNTELMRFRTLIRAQEEAQPGVRVDYDHVATSVLDYREHEPSSQSTKIEKRPAPLDKEEKFEEKVQRYFNFCRDALENSMMGIQLTTIELFHLKQIAKDVVEQYLDAERRKASHTARINPMTEISMRFLWEAYGIDVNTWKTSTLLKPVDGDPTPEARAYFKKLQEEMHFPGVEV